jgi:hypothetical protein
MFVYNNWTELRTSMLLQTFQSDFETETQLTSPKL